MIHHDLESCTVRVTGSLRDAMQAIDAGARQIALAVDAEGRLAGVLTDGDIRRALLGGAMADAPLADHMTRRFVAVARAVGRADVLDLMNARAIGAVPVVDEAGRPVGLHLLREVVRPAERDNWAVVMAGGKGTRLRPLTESVPKPMLRVAGRPILERIVLHLVGHGIRRIFLAINYLGTVIEDHFGDGSEFGCEIRYLREDAPLGTAGALTLLGERPTAPVLLMNGDLVTQADIEGMLDLHVARGDTATIGIRRYLHEVPFGCVTLDGDRVVGLEEKPTLMRDVSAGIYVLSPDLVARVATGRATDVPDLIGAAIDRGERVGAFEIRDDWVDVGQREQLDRARRGE